MKIRLLCGAMVLSWCATVGCVQAGANIEDLKTQERAKREQLYVLGEKIRMLEESIMASRKKSGELVIFFMDREKRQLLGSDKNRLLTDKELKDIQDAFMVEWMRFANSCMDVKNKKAECIVNDDFFNGIEDASVYKFYMLKCTYDVYTLKEMLSEWERLSDEMVAIKAQIEAIEGGL